MAVFLCRLDDGSGHDCASDDEHLPLSTVILFFSAILEACPSSPNLASLSSNSGQGRRIRYEIETCN